MNDDTKFTVRKLYVETVKERFAGVVTASDIRIATPEDIALAK